MAGSCEARMGRVVRGAIPLNSHRVTVAASGLSPRVHLICKGSLSPFRSVGGFIETALPTHDNHPRHCQIILNLVPIGQPNGPNFIANHKIHSSASLSL